ncbi:MAG: hypothetical protein Q8R20_03470 [Nanoarchaeota archaeon]|nr:hypothetical protein [Nanoarchaeota archaeon]
MSRNNTQSLLADAFQVLLDGLGPQKTTELWQVLVSPKKDYAEIRKELFEGKKVAGIYGEARKFNRKA